MVWRVIPANSSAQRARAVAVDYADFALAVQEASSRNLSDEIGGGFVRGLADRD